ncbi:MAG TPA: ribonuclease Y, partial [Egibacteraceae bacterium]|nr:ribonuclease Y [Egibacteraceae bacterium]
LAERHTQALERAAGLTAEQARRELLAGEEEAVRLRVRRLAADLEAEAREHAEARARDLIATAVQRLALSTVSPATTVAVPLPEGDMKARIIGKEGRNIRTFEERTGVNVVIDELPDAVLLSSFDPRRREVARVALRALIADGRIYPTTIEEQVALAEEHVSVETERAAIDAATDARVYDLSPELVESLGELYVRTSYGQNVLQHSVEVAHLAGMMAQELGVDADLARRAGLLHDIGKARGQDEPGSHAAVGARLAARIGEPAEVCHAIEAHHGEVEPATPEAVLVQVADQISLSRPGGPREPLEQHMSRMRAIEELCRSFDGVERVHAMQAGRDIRVMVSPKRVGDEEARELARTIAARVESELAFPGRVAVTVVRELRATEFVR